MVHSPRKKLEAIKLAQQTAQEIEKIRIGVRAQLCESGINVQKSDQLATKLFRILIYPPPPEEKVLRNQVIDEIAAPDIPTDSTQAAMNLAQTAEQEAEESANAQNSTTLEQEVNGEAINRDELEHQNSIHKENFSDSTEEAMTSCLFLWCRGCRILFAFMSNERDLPRQIVTTSKVKDAVVLFQCGTCKGKRNKIMTEVRIGLSRWTADQDDIAADKAAIDIHPDAWVGAEACMAASAMIGRDVRVLDNGKKQTAGASGLEVLRSMQPGEVAGKVDIEGFRTGIKGMRLLGYFEGGYV